MISCTYIFFFHFMYSTRRESNSILVNTFFVIGYIIVYITLYVGEIEKRAGLYKTIIIIWKYCYINRYRVNINKIIFSRFIHGEYNNIILLFFFINNTCLGSILYASNEFKSNQNINRALFRIVVILYVLLSSFLASGTSIRTYNNNNIWWYYIARL